MKDKFLGYLREDGRVGIRNHVLILPASICASDTAKLIARKVDKTVTFGHQLGCSQVGEDSDMTLRTVVGYGAHPNVYGVIIVGLGCENHQASLIKDEILKIVKKPIKTLVIQEEGGTVNTINKGIELASEMVKEAEKIKREEFPVSKLIVATECGGSDTTSGLASNPTIGELSDTLVSKKASVVLSETTEFIGAEHILARRAKNKEVHDKIYKIVKDFEDSIRENTGKDVREGNPSVGNQEGGLTTLEEKSLGCIHKAGSTTINNVYGYAEHMDTGEGLVIMDTPGNDPSSVAGMVAGGAQIVVFSTGRGTPTGHPIAPVIKVTANRKTWKMMEVNLDFDASGVIYGEKTMKEQGLELYNDLIEYANGKETKAEEFGFTETSIARVANFV